MTSRRSPPRRSSGSRAAFALALALALTGAARAGEPKLLDKRDGVEIDWAAGTVTATGGAAADLRMPSAEVARAGAARRAEATARTRLRAALEALPLGGGGKLETAELERALGRARVARTDYQSNGGALVAVAARFGDWLEVAPPAGGAPVVVLSVASMKLAAAPLAKVGEGPERRLGAALYRVGEPRSDEAALSVKVGKGERLTFAPKDKSVGEKLAQGVALIYVRSVP
jgi:hypothetical protein